MTDVKCAYNVVGFTLLEESEESHGWVCVEFATSSASIGSLRVRYLRKDWRRILTAVAKLSGSAVEADNSMRADRFSDRSLRLRVARTVLLLDGDLVDELITALR